MPAHPVARSLLKAFGGGIAAPSANRFGRISPTCADHVREELGLAPDLILDGGDCQVGLESTIISLVDDCPILLRPGGISLHELCEALGRRVALPVQPNPSLRVPGCHASHYAPLTPSFIVTAAHLSAVLQGLGDARQSAAILCHTKTVSDLYAGAPFVGPDKAAGMAEDGSPNKPCHTRRGSGRQVPAWPCSRASSVAF